MAPPTTCSGARWPISKTAKKTLCRDYIIPGNDDSSKAVTLYARGIADAVLEGRANAVDDLVKAVVAEGEDEFVEVDEAA